MNADYAKRRAGAALAAHRLHGARPLRKRRDRGPRKVALHFAGWVQTGGLHNPALCWDCNPRSGLGRVAARAAMDGRNGVIDRASMRLVGVGLNAQR